MDPAVFFIPFEELSEQDRQRFIESANLAFCDFAEGAVFDPATKNVTLTPYVQAKVTYNALSHKQQLILTTNALVFLLKLVRMEVDNPSDRLSAAVLDLEGLLSPEALGSIELVPTMTGEPN